MISLFFLETRIWRDFRKQQKRCFAHFCRKSNVFSNFFGCWVGHTRERFGGGWIVDPPPLSLVMEMKYSYTKIGVRDFGNHKKNTRELRSPSSLHWFCKDQEFYKTQHYYFLNDYFADWMSGRKFFFYFIFHFQYSNCINFQSLHYDTLFQKKMCCFAFDFWMCIMLMFYCILSIAWSSHPWLYVANTAWELSIRKNQFNHLKLFATLAMKCEPNDSVSWRLSISPEGSRQPLKQLHRLTKPSGWKVVVINENFFKRGSNIFEVY